MLVLVTAVGLVQLLPGGLTFPWVSLALVIPLVAMNAFTEEVVFRLSCVTMEAETGPSVYGLAMGSLVFGVMHYWGAAPSGVVGALMSAVLGLVLAGPSRRPGASSGRS